MLTSHKDDVSTTLDLFQWFRDLLKNRGVTHVMHFEDTPYVREYLENLYRELKREEGSLCHRTETMNKEIERLNGIADKRKLALKSIGLEEAATSLTVHQLAELHFLCSSSTLEPSSLLIGLDRIINKREASRKALLNVTELYQKAKELHFEISSQTGKLGQARKDFEGWGRRDCELGIKELGAALSTVVSKKTEYQERLSKLQNEWESRKNGQPDSNQRLPDIAATLEAIINKRKDLGEVEELLSPYAALPPDVTLARVEVDRARHELETLISLRDKRLRSFDK